MNRDYTCKSKTFFFTKVALKSGVLFNCKYIKITNLYFLSECEHF